MNYDTAAKIVAEHAPQLILDPEVKGQAHICVRAGEKGDPFSIVLPDASKWPESMQPSADDTPQAEKDSLIASLDAAVKHFG